MSILILCLIVSGTSLFVLTVFSLLYLWSVRLKSSKTAPRDSSPTACYSIGEAANHPALRPFSYRELRAMTECFRPRNELGRGGSGTVFQGRLPDGKYVAVKKLEFSSLQAEREYQNEIQILGGLHSPNVISLLGYCSDTSRRALVYEFMPNRSLQEVLFSSNKKLEWSHRYRIILDIAKALWFLHHDCNPPVIHGDIKPSNVLLGSDFSAKLSDFGISRVGIEVNSRFEFFSQDLEKNSQLNSETDFGFPLSTTKPESGVENLVLTGTEVTGDHCRSDHSKELGITDLEAQVREDCWWRQEDSFELVSRDFIMEWIGDQIHESAIVQNCIGRNDDPQPKNDGEDTKKGKERKMKELWEEEYFTEMNKKRNGFKRIEDGLKRLRSARLWRRQGCASESNNSGDLLSFSRNWRWKKTQLPCDGTWCGDLFSKELSSTTSMLGTLCYVAPEYGGCGYLTEKGDVYSFDVLVLVVVSGRRPSHISSSPMELHKANLISWARQLAQTGNVMDLVDESLENEYNVDEASLYINLALLCLQKMSESRPDGEVIVRILSRE